MKKHSIKKGFTLVEILFYFAIVGVALTAMMNFSLQIMNVGRQSENLHEIQSSVNIFMEKISYSIRTAESIDAIGSVFDNENGELALITSDPSTSPTKFYLSEGDIYMEEGLSSAIKINSATVKCTKLNFKKIEYEKTPDQIIITAEFEPANAETLSQEQTIKIKTAVSLRK